MVTERVWLPVTASRGGQAGTGLGAAGSQSFTTAIRVHVRRVSRRERLLQRTGVGFDAEHFKARVQRAGAEAACFGKR